MRITATISAIAAVGLLLGPTAATARASESADSDAGSLHVMVVSDIHVLARDLIADTEAYRSVAGADRKLVAASQAVFEAAIERIEQEAPDVLLIPGDLSFNGEQASHEAVASLIEQLKQQLDDTHVYITDGNHDINMSGATDFAAGTDQRTSPADFERIYDTVYSDETVTARYTPPAGSQAGGLSYVAQPAAGYTVISLDAGRYSADATDSGTDEAEGTGALTPELLEWTDRQLAAAEQRGDVVLGMTHYGVIEHMSLEPMLLDRYLLDEHRAVGDRLAAGGMDYIFTGHFHVNDIAQRTSSAGDRLVDVETGSLVSYPAPIRHVRFSREAVGTAVTATAEFTTDVDLSVPASPDPLTGGTADAIDDLTQATLEMPGNQLTLDQAVAFASSALGRIGMASLADASIDDAIRSALQAPVDPALPVAEQHTVLEFVTRAYHTMARGDEQIAPEPAWFVHARDCVNDGTMMRSMLDAADGQLPEAFTAIVEQFGDSYLNDLFASSINAAITDENGTPDGAAVYTTEHVLPESAVVEPTPDATSEPARSDDGPNLLLIVGIPVGALVVIVAAVVIARARRRDR